MSVHLQRKPLSQAQLMRGRRVWLKAAPRMTRLARIVIRLRVHHGWSPERICRRLHITRRKFRRHLLIAIRQIDRASRDLNK